MIEYFQIAIDGPSGSGKSTVAKRVAEVLELDHIDSGAIYRSIAFFLDKNGDDMSQLDNFNYQTKVESGVKRHLVCGEDVSKAIRAPAITEKSSEIAARSEIREFCNKIQRLAAKDKNVVLEGRDIGSEVFPNAMFKFYLTASLKERANRRWLELRKRQPEKKFEREEVKKLLEERDYRDSNREHSPLICSLDAIQIDTTHLSIDKVVQKIVKRVRNTHKKKWRPLSTLLLGKDIAQASFIYRLASLLFYSFYKIFYRLKVYGLEHFPPVGEATLITPNHASFHDPPVLGSVCPQTVWAVGQDYLFKVPILRYFLPKMNTMPVTNSAYDKGMIKKVIRILTQGGKVIIFPEGKRSETGEILELKRGVSMIASQAECKLLPVIIEGAYESYPAGSKVPKFWGHKISICFGPALDWKDYVSKHPSKKEAQAEILKDLRERLLELQKEFREQLQKEGRLPIRKDK